MKQETDSPIIEERIELLERQVAALVEAKAADPLEAKGKQESTDAKWYAQTETVVKYIGTIITSLAGMTALFYVLGFVIVNLHLSSFGVKDFSLAKATYLSAGIVFVIATVLGFLPIAVPYLLGYSRNLGRMSSPSLVWILSLFILSFTWLFHSVPLVIMLSDSYNRLFMLMDSYPILAGLLAALLPWSFLLTFESKLPRGTTIAYASFAFLLLLLVWGKTVYPKLSIAFGGGELIDISLELEQDADHNLLDRYNIAVTDNLMEPVKLIDETKDYFVVLARSGVVARIDKSMVANMVHPAPEMPKDLEWPDLPTLTPTPIPPATPTPSK